MLEHTVKPGDSIPSIAFEHGLFPDTIWNHPDNAELKKKRQDPNVLLPGDIVHVPDKREKTMSKPAEKLYKFRRKGVPSLLKFQLMKDGKPRAHEKYKLEVGDRTYNGATDGEGCLKEWVSPSAQSGKLILSEQETYMLALGHLDPEGTESGARARLVNLGYLSKADAPLEEYKDALESFQADQKLSQNGVLDAATQKKLKVKHGT